MKFAPLGFVHGVPTQLLQVGPDLQSHVDLLQVGVEGAGEAGSGSTEITTESVRLEVGGHCLVCGRLLIHA